MTAAHTITRTDAIVAVLAHMLIKWRKPLGLFFMLLTLGLGYSALDTALTPASTSCSAQAQVHGGLPRALQHLLGREPRARQRAMEGEGDIYNAEFLPTCCAVELTRCSSPPASTVPACARSSLPTCASSKSPSKASTVTWSFPPNSRQRGRSQPGTRQRRQVRAWSGAWSQTT